MSKPRECICHASWSGYDEEEYKARGCPSCECWKIDAYDNQAELIKELVLALVDVMEDHDDGCDCWHCQAFQLAKDAGYET